MVILEDVEAKDLTSEFALFTVQGPNASRALQRHIPLPTLDAADAEGENGPVTVLRSDRTGSGGWDLLVPRSNSALPAALRKTFEPILPEAFDAARLEAGIPAAGRDWDCRTLPPELGPAFEASHISYRKGCYTGQEVLMRIHSRGHTNRTWVALISDRPMGAGSGVSHPRRKDAGVVTSSCHSPDFGFVAGAMLRNEALSEGDSVFVQNGRETIEAEIRYMPILRMD